jgi:hypothetical protein
MVILVANVPQGDCNSLIFPAVQRELEQSIYQEIWPGTLRISQKGGYPLIAFLLVGNYPWKQMANLGRTI